MVKYDHALLHDNQAVCAILNHVCESTQMGFAAVAHVTETRWVACQVLDKIEFGLNPGDELAIKCTICDDIRRTGSGVIIEHVAADRRWAAHPVPILYGFKSYVSLPIVLADGSFFGTLCAIDAAAMALPAAAVWALMEQFAVELSTVLSEAFAAAQPA